MLLVPPADRINTVLQKYRLLKHQQPHSTSAVIMVPRWLNQDWRKQLKGMKLIKHYSAGSQIFARAGKGPEQERLLPGIRHAYEAWYDAPAPKVSMRVAMRQELTMQFDGKVAGTPVRVLADTGASEVAFVSRAFAEGAGLHIGQTQATKVVLGDGTAETMITGTCNLPLKIQGYQGKVQAFVMDTLLEGFDVVLGDKWLRAHAGTLDYKRRVCVVHCRGKAVTLRPWGGMGTGLDTSAVLKDALQGAKPASPHKVVSAMAMKRTINHAGFEGDVVFLVHVTHVEEDTARAATCDGTWREAQIGDDPDDPYLLPKGRLEQLLLEFCDVFPSELPAGLPPDRNIGHTIPLIPGAKPTSRPLYRLSKLEMDEVRKQVKELLAKGLIEPSKSPYGAPITFALKKDGTLRMCIDYRALNKITVRNQWPIPRPDDTFDALAGAKVYSALDMQSGYFQLRINDEDVEKTAFKVPGGLYQWRVLPFGLTNAPSTFQAAMSSIFGDLIGKCLLIYLDDLIVFSRSAEEHEVHLRQVLSRLREHRLYAKAKKCEFNMKELPFLGHIVGRDGIKVDPRKTAAIQAWPVPKGQSEVRSFLGLANYFRRFLDRYAIKVAPLTDLLGQKVAWDWNEKCQEAFEWVKHALSTAPVLKLPEPDKPFTVVTDASEVGLGAVLLQDGRPVAYESRKLKPAEKNYTTTEKEMLGVVHAMRTWRCYLEGGGEILILTDHNPNTYFDSKPMLSRREARWAEFLSSFHFRFQYKPGKENTAADALSRIVPVGVMVLTKPLPEGRLYVRVPHVTLAALTRGKAVKEAVAKQAAEEGARAARTPAANEALAEYRARFTADGQPILPAVDVPVGPQERRSVRVAEKAKVRVDAQPSTSGSDPHARPAVRHRGKAGKPKPSLTQARAAAQQAREMASELRRTTLHERFKQGYADDPKFEDPGFTKGLTHREGLWWKDGTRIVVPGFDAYKDAVLREMHDAPYSGHMGIQKTLRAVSGLYWWPAMRREVTAWVQTCDSCQRMKGDRQNQGLLQPLKIPTRPWDTVTMDLITGLPDTPEGYDAVVVFVDKLTKMVHLAATRTDADGTDIARIFMREVWRLHGLPVELVSDRDSKFTGDFCREVCRRVGTKQSMSTAFHPQSDGQTERVNRVLEDYLRHYVGADQRDWADHLDAAEFALNNARHDSTEATPFMLNYGQHPNTPLKLLVDDAKGRSKDTMRAKEFVEHIKAQLDRAKECLKRAQDRQSEYANVHRKDVSFQVGDHVMLHTKNLTLTGVRKLLPRWLGPFKVVKRVNPVAYRLELPKAMGRIHPVFHVGLLKPYRADCARTGVRPLMPVLHDEQGPVFEVERVLDHMDRPDGPGGAMQRHYKIRWRGYTEDDDSWEPECNLVRGSELMIQEYLKSTRGMGMQRKRGKDGG